MGSSGGKHEITSRELQIVDPTSSASTASFKLPRGWTVEERPRRNSSSHRFDKYYYEPETGRQFRSLSSIQKYLSGEEDTISPKRLKHRNGENMQIMPFVTKSAASFGLPDDWIVQEIPRKNINYAGCIDRYYIEPGTGLRFRSRLSAEKYLQEVKTSRSTTNSKDGSPLTLKNISDEDLPLGIILKRLKDGRKIKMTSKAIRIGSHSMHSRVPVSREEDVSSKEVKDSTPIFASRPAKVKWVLGGPIGSVWNAFMDETMVPESLKQEWSENFVSSINDNC